mgnify:CR=1 FL=1
MARPLRVEYAGAFYDWEPDWVFFDRRFNLLRASDDEFLAFLCEMVHPVVRANPEEAK